MNSIFRQMLPQATRLLRQPVRGYATAPTSAKGLAERAQQLGQSVAKSAEPYAEPIVYNLRVAGSLLKQVYITEKLAPPTSLSQIVGAYRQIWSTVTNPSWWTHSLPGGDWRLVLVYGVEAVGIFSIGEMIGKRRIVGYKINEWDSDSQHHH